MAEPALGSYYTFKYVGGRVYDNPIQQSLHRIAAIAAKQDAMSKARLAKAY